MKEEFKRYLTQCCAGYKAGLKDDILPFWMKYGYDRKHGGVYTCVDRDGGLMDRTKSVWFQGRFGYGSRAVSDISCPRRHSFLVLIRSG